MSPLAKKIQALPPELRQEVEDFVDALRREREPRQRQPMNLNWRGALSDLKDEYTSVELQHKLIEWRAEN